MTRFYADRLLSSRLSSNIILEFQFIKNLNQNTGALGFCGWDDDNHRPRAFTIEIDRDLIDDELQLGLTIAHEMIHLKQYARGELKQMLKNNRYKWKGEMVEENSVKYRHLPWEIEARELELVLFKEYKKSLSD